MMSGEDAILTVPVSARDHMEGNAHAVVTLVEYGDFQCPACGMAYPAVKQIQRRYAGNLRFVFRHFPLSQAHPYARMAAELAEAAAVEGQFWPMHDWLYENQDDWVASGSAGLEAGVRALGLDEEALAATLRYCPVLATEPEGRLAAIVDFTFNLGAGRLQTSTLRRRVNQRDWSSAVNELRRWVYGGGKVLPGLVARREAESALLG